MSTEQAPPFGVLLRRYRAAAGLTQEELAERARLSAHGISNLERGERRAQCRDSARAVLGEAAFAAAWAEGQVLTLDQAIAVATESAGVPGLAVPEAAPTDSVPTQLHDTR